MMAATYPLEVVEAARWVNANPNLKGDQLASALEQRNWDPSVKSLVNFPNALAMMDGNIEWTQKLGDAFLAQKDQVMDTIQYLRGRAQTQGNLLTTAEQVVRTQDNIIAIEPANPQVVYVPVYNPSVVYGQWWYPDYPPYYYYPPGYVIGDLIGGILSFGVGLVLGAAWWGWAWGGFDWYNHGVYCDPYRYGYGYGYGNGYGYNDNHWYPRRSQPGSGGHREWMHDPNHRRNVSYRDAFTREKYGQTPRPQADVRRDVRGSTPVARTSGTRIGDRPTLEQRRGNPGSDRTAVDFDRRMAASTNHRSLTERRMNPSMSGRTSMDKRQESPIVVERLATQRPPRPTAPSASRVTARPSYQASGSMSPSFQRSDGVSPSRRFETVNPSMRGGLTSPPQRAASMRHSGQDVGMRGPSPRVERVNPSNQGMSGFAGVGRGGFQSAERGGGGFSGKSGAIGGGSSGNARGGFSGRAGGFGGRG